MTKLRNTTLALLATAIFAVPALAGPGHDHGKGHDHAADHAHKAKVGEMAPDFELIDHAGNTHKLSDYKGKVVVLEWINPECPFVVRHYNEKTMTTLAAQHSDVVWLAIDSSNDGKTIATAASSKAWADKYSMAHPILLDNSGKVGHTYQAKTTPHMFVIDAEGKLVYDGAIDSDPRGNAEDRVNYVAAALEAVKAGKPVETATTKPYGCSVKYATTQEKQAKASR